MNHLERDSIEVFDVRVRSSGGGGGHDHEGDGSVDDDGSDGGSGRGSDDWVLDRGLHSSTFRLDVSTFCCIC